MQSTTSRKFALEIVQQLQSRGFVAYWVGGCVRDQLLGQEVKDFDVATNATPKEIRQLFGQRQTYGVGAAFGVTLVRGQRGMAPVEVATFRRDAKYSDGRHPDSVTFSSPEEDAQRRDFTINGMFYDPITDQIVDYVNGQQDLRNRIVRAIGDADQRIGEDKLRMLRAVRFAASFGFQLDKATTRAISTRAEDIRLVSAERIGDELRRMLDRSCRLRSLQLLIDTQLITVLMPEFSLTADWPLVRRILDHLRSNRFSVTLASWLYPISNRTENLQVLINQLQTRWRLSNAEIREISQLVRDQSIVRTAHELPWSDVQPVLADDLAEETVNLATAIANTNNESADGIELCQKKLALPAELLDPRPLLSGSDLIELGMPRGPAYKTILKLVRDRQLNGEVLSKEEAKILAREIWNNTLNH